jgi:hypothetical protein
MNLIEVLKSLGLIVVESTFPMNLTYFELNMV